MDGKIFDIQRFSIHDGPGIRTTVFLKGCNLKCLWCHNPESQSSTDELLFYQDKCIGCGACRRVCRKNENEPCVACGKCVTVCPRDARELAGKTVSAKEVMETVLKDKKYYVTSGGGVTLSGGEPLLQRDFVLEILKNAKANDLHTAIETAGNVQWETFEQVLPYLDLILYDIKAIDEKTHRHCTGVSNRLILENAEKLKKQSTKLLFRMPVVPGYNDAEVKRVRAFTEGFDLELMPYHEIAKNKYRALSRPYHTEDASPPSKDEMEKLATEIRAIYSPSGI